VIFIQHTEAGGWKREAKGLRCCLNSISLLTRFTSPKPPAMPSITPRLTLLREQGIREFVICGCATDYCVDATIKNGVSRVITSPWLKMPIPPPIARRQMRILINHHNDVWRNFIAPAISR
jgi:hypothetical protein